ncbi:MAG: hypothetical protein HQL69_07300 [Magnetococcales bacterium]|nr:hypothetical protein [Magnetococcales bacterium]
MKYLILGKNSKGFFLSHDEKLLMECVKLEHIQAVAPQLEADGIIIKFTNIKGCSQQDGQGVLLSG